MYNQLHARYTSPVGTKVKQFNGLRAPADWLACPTCSLHTASATKYSQQASMCVLKRIRHLANSACLACQGSRKQLDFISSCSCWTEYFETGCHTV